MIQLVETVQNFRALLVTLKIRDETEHAMVQLLVSTAEAHEHLGNVSTRTSLVGSDSNSGFLNLVERINECADLVVRFLGNWTKIRELI